MARPRALQYITGVKYKSRRYPKQMNREHPARAGRPRDRRVDEVILATVRQHMARTGLAGLSIAAVADDAGTTRPTVYRRWPTKLELAVAAVADLAEVEPPLPTDDPFADLVAELEHFRHCITDASALALAGVMLADGLDQSFRDAYRDHLVRPRRARLRSCLDRGMVAGALDPHADLDVAGSLMTGSWYAFAIGGAPVPDDWAARVAALVWRACGGDRSD
jgi:AcrR family transcriptional regulator